MPNDFKISPVVFEKKKIKVFFLFIHMYTGLKLRAHNKNLIFLFLNQTYATGTQKNRLNKTALLSTQNIC